MKKLTFVPVLNVFTTKNQILLFVINKKHITETEHEDLSAYPKNEVNKFVRTAESGVIPLMKTIFHESV